MDKQDKRLTQPERAFWRDAYIGSLAAMIRNDSQVPVVSSMAADFADAAVHEYQVRILWRGRK